MIQEQKKAETNTSPTLDACIEQFYAGAQVFMNLGFDSDAIRVTKNIVGPGQILYWGMHLEWQGKEFNVFVLPDAWMTCVSDEEFNTKWNAFVLRMSAKPRDEELHAHMKTVVENSFLWTNRVTLAHVLLRKGIIPPVMDGLELGYDPEREI